MIPETLWHFLILPGIPLGAMVLWASWWISRRNQRSRRPFMDMPRPAGWSLQERTQNLLFDAVLEAVLLTAIGVFIGLVSSFKDPSIFVMIFGLGGSVFFALRLRLKLISFANHSLGLQGEQLVGSTLDRLSSDSIHIFHDIEIKLPGNKPWNIDHVALTPAGLFVFETKARRKPLLGHHGHSDEHKVVFDGNELQFPNALIDRKAPWQARRNAEWLARKLSMTNAISIPVSPAIVIPGWWVDRTGRGTVCVLNEKQIKSYISTSPAALPKQLFNAISNQLSELSRVSFA